MKNIKIEPPYDITKIKEIETQSGVFHVYYDNLFMGLFCSFFYTKEFIQHSDNEGQIYDSKLAQWYMESKMNSDYFVLIHDSGWNSSTQSWFSIKIREKESTNLSRVNCETAERFHHVSLKNADGTPVRIRRTGKTKLWKTRPEDFKIPVKYGLRECFYLTPFNAKDWTVVN